MSKSGARYIAYESIIIVYGPAAGGLDIVGGQSQGYHIVAFAPAFPLKQSIAARKLCVFAIKNPVHMPFEGADLRVQFVASPRHPFSIRIAFMALALKGFRETAAAPAASRRES